MAESVFSELGAFLLHGPPVRSQMAETVDSRHGSAGFTGGGEEPEVHVSLFSGSPNARWSLSEPDQKTQAVQLTFCKNWVAMMAAFLASH